VAVPAGFVGVPVAAGEVAPAPSSESEEQPAVASSTAAPMRKKSSFIECSVYPSL
jgi:hypothetical protein